MVAEKFVQATVGLASRPKLVASFLSTLVLLIAILFDGAATASWKSCLQSLMRTYLSEPALVKTPLFPYEEIQLDNSMLEHVPMDIKKFLLPGTEGPFLERGECKPQPEDERWPLQSEWDAFNQSLNGRLLESTPIAAVCYPQWKNYNFELCRELVEKWTDPWLHEEHPTSVMWPLWQGNTCLPTLSPANSTCTLGGFPELVVNASTVAHVQLAVNFCRNKGLRLVVKNTGHDYFGKSCGAGSLSIWTHYLNGLEYIPAHTINGIITDVMHIGAGERTLDIYQVADENGACVVGGMCGSVGFAGGYYAGGGHSPLSSLHGMAADHIIAIGVVTADGEFLSVNEQSHPDLFWALRGGGASTFGVTTSVLVKVHPTMKLSTSWITFETSAEVDEGKFWLGVRAYFEHFVRFNDAGCYGYMNIRRNYNRYNNSAYSLGIEPMMAPNMTAESLGRLLAPFFEQLNELKIPYRETRKEFASFLPGFKDAWPERLQTVTTPTMTEGTRFFSKELWEDRKGFETAFDAIRRVSVIGHDITGWHFSLHNPSNSYNSINPAMRHTVAFFTTGVLIPEMWSGMDLITAQTKLDQILDYWRVAAPRTKYGGSYWNEASIMEPEWQESLFGSNYPRLLNIKRKWDSTGLFYATTGVGSEEWEVRTQDQGLQTQNGPLCKRKLSSM